MKGEVETAEAFVDRLCNVVRLPNACTSVYDRFAILTRQRDAAIRAEQSARITELEAALRFYADPDSYDDAGAPGHTCHLGTDDEYFEADYGARARAALEKP